MGRFGVEENEDLTELENWLRKHAERLAPAIEAASKDENEHIRFTAMIQLATLTHATKLDPESLRLPIILLTAASDASPDVRCLAIDLLTSDEFAPAIKSQNAQVGILPSKSSKLYSKFLYYLASLSRRSKADAFSLMPYCDHLVASR